MEQKESGFPWMILRVILALICLGGIVVLAIMLKRGEFEDEAETDDNVSIVTDTDEEMSAEGISGDLPEDEEEDAEIDLIDAFFASLDKE